MSMHWSVNPHASPRDHQVLASLGRRRFVQSMVAFATLGGLGTLLGCEAPAATPAASPSIAPTSAASAPTAPPSTPTTAPTAPASTPTTALAPNPTAGAPTPTGLPASPTAVPTLAATSTPVSQPSPTAAIAVAPAPVAGKPMYQVDAQHTGRSPYAGPSKSVLLRTFEMSSLLTTVAGAAPPREDIQSASAIGPDGTIYLADFPGNLVALRDPGQGTSLTLVWRFHPAGGSSLHATPAVGPDGSVYLGFGAGTGTAARTTFYAVKAPTSGTEASVNWSVDLGAGRMTSSPTIGPDGTIYAYSGSGKLYAISAAGEVKWTAPAGPSLRSSPALGPDGTVYLPSTDGKLYAITPPAAGATTGSVAWTFDFGQHLGPTPLLTVTTGRAGGGGANGIGSGASPTIGPDGTVYVGANNSNFYAIGPDGALKWLYEAEREVAGIWSTAALSLDGKTLYFGANKGGIYALNSADGSRAWQFPIYGSVYSSPALGSNGTLYTGSTVGHVFAINSNTGQQVFDYNAGQEVWTAPSILPNGTLLVADRKGRVLLLGNG